MVSNRLSLSILFGAWGLPTSRKPQTFKTPQETSKDPSKKWMKLRGLGLRFVLYCSFWLSIALKEFQAYRLLALEKVGASPPCPHINWAQALRHRGSKLRYGSSGPVLGLALKCQDPKRFLSQDSCWPVWRHRLHASEYRRR